MYMYRLVLHVLACTIIVHVHVLALTYRLANHRSAKNPGLIRTSLGAGFRPDGDDGAGLEGQPCRGGLGPGCLGCKGIGEGSVDRAATDVGCTVEGAGAIY